MSKFLTHLDVSQTDDTSHEGRGSWVLITPLTYQSDLAGTLTVPTGFSTDFATVPRIPIVFDILGDRGNLAATIHDYMYTVSTTGEHPVKDRATADAVLREALIAQGVPRWAAYLMWAGVRIGGSSFWK